MNQSDIRMRQNVCRRLSAARRRQKYEPGFTSQNGSLFSEDNLSFGLFFVLLLSNIVLYALLLLPGICIA